MQSSPGLVSLRQGNSERFPSNHDGKVLSERARCTGDRKVVVYKQKGRHQEPSTDKKIASDISERHGDHGDWNVGNTGYKKGKFYAKAKKSPGCAKGFSKTIKL